MKIFLSLAVVFVAPFVTGDDFDDAIRRIQSRRKGLAAFSPNTVRLNNNRKSIDAGAGGVGRQLNPQTAAFEALVDRVSMLYAGNKQASAGSDSRLASTRIDGQQASASRFGSVGGFAKASQNSGLMRLNNSGQNRKAWLTANGRHDLDTVAEGTDRFTADADQHKMMVDPDSFSSNGGTGRLAIENKDKSDQDFWLYELESSDQQEASVLLSENVNSGSSFARNVLRRRAKKYRCQAKAVGESVCFDQAGREVGKTVATDNGEVLIYSNHGVPVARANVHKDSDTKYRAIVNQGLMTARTESIEEYDCFSELTNGKVLKDKIEVLKPLSFKYKSQTLSDGSETYRFPDCFQIGGRIKLPSGVDPARIATEYVVNILPLGKLKCMDPGSCGRECYYCNLCNKTNHKLDLLRMSESNVCGVDGGRIHDIKMTVCPPADTFNWLLCSTFSKNILERDYWQKKGDIDVQIRFYLRPENEAQLAEKFHQGMNKPGYLGQLFKSGIFFDWLRSQKISLRSAADPSDSELKEFYIQQNSAGGDELLGCHRSVIKYRLGGTKVDTTFLIEAAGSNNLMGVFHEKPCEEWSKLDQEQYERDAEEILGREDQGTQTSVLRSGFFRRL